MTTKGKVTKEERAQLLGLAGFILYALEHGDGLGYVCANVGHDIGGMMAKANGVPGAEFFSPRTARYAKYAPESAQLKATPNTERAAVALLSALDAEGYELCTQARAELRAALGVR